ncbi:sodium/myo-inositol cotransporter-like [Mytilus trossulus]|uniref:sodium/myo-inositol cotransporter-like n=1 Tax=Mytilus trossulus TaxID=6551 RepID=UPI003004AFC3
MAKERLELFKQNHPQELVKLSKNDIGVIVGYFCLVVLIGIFAMWRANRGTVSGYFLAGRAMYFIPVGLSLFVSNIGTEHFIGLSGSGAANGISVGAWEFNAILLLQLLGFVFIPVYIACGTVTMPEYLSKRFGGVRLRVYFAVLSLILYIFTKCSGDLFTGALFIQQSLGWDLYLSIFILIVITGIITIAGGLTAVIYTDTMQAILMVGGGLTLMGISFNKIGGYDGLVRRYNSEEASTNVSYRLPNTTCHEPDPNAFRMLREADDDYMPWPGFLLGQTPGSIWYWCADQVIVQRLLAAKSVSHAQGATLLAGFIKILPLFMMVMPGMISRILYADEVACVDPDICYHICQSEAGCTNIAYPRLVLGLMPDGLRGLMMAVMVAALMSDLDSIFNSASTLFTIDIYNRIRKNSSVREDMIVGRIFILVMIGVSIAWIPVIKEIQGGQIFIYIQEITDYLAPPFAAVFLLAVLVPRVNEKGAFWSLMIALLTGIIRMILVFVYHDSGGCDKPDNRPDILKNFHYMYFSLFITLMTGALAIIISLFTEPPADKYLYRTTFWTRHRNDPPPDLEDTLGAKHSQINIAYTASENDIHLSVNGDRNPQVFTVNPGEQRKVFRDPDLDKQESASDDISCGEKAVNLLCGFGKGKQDEEQAKALEAHVKKVQSLQQGFVTKIGLRFGMVVILAIGTFLYFFWSYWKYEP